MTGELAGTPDQADVGIHSDITISVTDNVNPSVELAPFSIEVISVNISPTISGAPATTVDVGSDYAFTPDANDTASDRTFTFPLRK